jgi:drug/metabolite transporter (DMT)-like permease
VTVFLIGLLVLFYSSIGSSISKGDTLSVLCAFFFAVHILLAQRLVRQEDVINVTAVQICAVALISGIVAAIQGNIGVSTLSIHTGIAVLYAGIFATVVAFGGQLFAQTRIDETSTALILSLEPVVAAVLSVVIGRDSGSWALLIGGSLMFIGAVVGQLSPASIEPKVSPQGRSF